MEDKHLYDFFEVELQFRDRVYGGLPKSKELIESYVAAKFGEENADLAEKIKGESDLINEEEKITTGFKVTEDGKPCINNYQLKALMRECARMLRITTKKRGSKEDITKGLFFKPERIPFANGTKTPLPREDFCGHVSTPRGKRSILKASEYVEKGRIKFTIQLVKTAILKKTDLDQMWAMGQEIGIGSQRSFEKGKFDVIKFERLNGKSTKKKKEKE